MAVTRLLLTGTFGHIAAGTSAFTPASGRVTVTPNTRVLDTAGDVLLEPKPYEAVLDASGVMDSVSVVASDSADIIPTSGLYYTIVEDIVGVGRKRWRLAPTIADAPQLDITAASPLGTVPAIVFPTGDLATHLTDTLDAHDAGAVSVEPFGAMSEINVQDALLELHSIKADVIPPGTYVDTTTAQTAAGAKRWSGLGSFDASVRFKRNPLIDITHPDFGGDDSGETDTTAAWNALMTECVGVADPATTSRRARGIPFLPAGVFRFNSPMSVRSVLGLRIMGSGPENTRIRFHGALASGLSLNGIAHSIIEGFTLESDAAADLTEAISLWWDSTGGSPTQAARSTTQNEFRHVSLANCRCRVGLHLGDSTSSNQVDSTTLHKVHLRGGWLSGDNTYYQAGLMVGSGIAGNNLLHHAYGCTSVHWRRNVHVASSELGWHGGSFGDAESDIYISGFSNRMLVDDVRSETSQRLLTFAGGGSAPSNVSLTDILWSADALNADGRWIDYPHGGHLGLRNVRIHNQPGGIVPKIYASSPKPLTITADGLTAQQAFSTVFDVNATTTVLARGFTEIDAAKLIVAQTPVWPIVAGTSTEYVLANQLFTDTTLTEITDLTTALAANEVVQFEAVIYYDATTANDLRLSVVVPAGAAIAFGVDGLSTAVTSFTGNALDRTRVISGDSIDVGGARAAGAAVAPLLATVKGHVLNGANAGNLVVRASKFANTDTTSPADNTTIYAGSHIRVFRG